MTAATAPPKPKRSPALLETRLDESGLTVSLPKQSRAALYRARDLCLAVERAVPTLKAQAKGVAAGLQRLIDDLSSVITVTDEDADGEQP